MVISKESLGLSKLFKGNFARVQIRPIMASQVNWKEILDGRYPSYKVEVNGFIESVDISSSTEVSIDHIYDAIKSDPNVCNNLKLLYHEAVYGSNKEVKKRIKSHVSNFRRALV